MRAQPSVLLIVDVIEEPADDLGVDPVDRALQLRRHGLLGCRLFGLLLISVPARGEFRAQAPRHAACCRVGFILGLDYGLSLLALLRE